MTRAQLLKVVVNRWGGVAQVSLLLHIPEDTFRAWCSPPEHYAPAYVQVAIQALLAGYWTPDQAKRHIARHRQRPFHKRRLHEAQS